MNFESVAGKAVIVTAMILLITMIAACTAQAFHNGGIGECEGCHNMKEPGNNIYNLKGRDQSSTCLLCHEKKPGGRMEEHFVSTASPDMPSGTPPAGMTPGGDFGWIKKDYGVEAGEVHGHNIIAADFGYQRSSRPVAPGGKYPASSLHCSSCHDPHGRYRRNADGSIVSSGASIGSTGSYANSPDPAPGSPVGVYRMLGGVGYLPASAQGGTPFTKDPPAAVSPATYNRAEAASQTRVAYGSGMSEWCSNCHADMHGSAMSHPAGGGVKLGEKIAANYNAYVRTGDLSGNRSSAYLSLAPYEEGTSDYTALKGHARSDDSFLEGPDAKANVSCLSCHRAHASGWKYILRFDTNAAFVTVSGNDGARYPDASQEPDIAKGRNADEIRRAYYDRPAKIFSPSQRALCSKCHGKD